MVKELPSWEHVEALRKDLSFHEQTAESIRNEILVESVNNAKAFYELWFNNHPLSSIGKVVKFLAFCERLEIKWRGGSNPLGDTRTIDEIDKLLHRPNTSVMFYISDEGEIIYEPIIREGL